jgi:hypothetical protein
MFVPDGPTETHTQIFQSPDFPRRLWRNPFSINEPGLAYQLHLYAADGLSRHLRLGEEPSQAGETNWIGVTSLKRASVWRPVFFRQYDCPHRLTCRARCAS